MGPPQPPCLGVKPRLCDQRDPPGHPCPQLCPQRGGCPRAASLLLTRRTLTQCPTAVAQTDAAVHQASLLSLLSDGASSHFYEGKLTPSTSGTLTRGEAGGHEPPGERRHGGRAGGPGPRGLPGKPQGPGHEQRPPGSPARRTWARAHLHVLQHPLHRREVGLRLRAHARRGLEVGRQLEERRPAVGDPPPEQDAPSSRFLSQRVREGWRSSGVDSTCLTCTDPHVHTRASHIHAPLPPGTDTVLAQAVTDRPRVTPPVWQSPATHAS